MSTSQSIKLHNTLTRSRDLFEPIDSDNVRLYVCGPTVYDYAHIGNARPAIVFDVLFRFLRHIYGEAAVTYVRNITDVDDKIIARASVDHPDMDLNEAISEVTKRTENQYQKDMKALGCMDPTHQPRATENINQMIDLVGELLVKNHAYQAKNSNGLREVLFDVTSMEAYGKLSNRKLEDQQAGARVAVENHKKNSGDFVLWKEAAKAEPGWDSPYGFGRPGWHLECSAMSARYLGQHFDIHGGGLDLIFPHHENEIAQTCCAHGTDKMANVWMHNGFLQLEGRKMSKSEGNFITVNELLETDKFGGKKWDGAVVRLAMLMTHYREPIDFSQKRLEEAEKILKSWSRIAKKLENSARSEGFFGDFVVSLDAPKPVDSIINKLCDDLNTSRAVGTLQALFGAYSRNNEAYVGLNAISSAMWLGIDIEGYAERLADVQSTLSESEIEAQIEKRLAAFEAKDWAQADAIRDELKTKGIQLKDAKDPDTGARVTTWELV